KKAAGDSEGPRIERRREAREPAIGRNRMLPIERGKGQLDAFDPRGRDIVEDLVPEQQGALPGEIDYFIVGRHPPIDWMKEGDEFGTEFELLRADQSKSPIKQ